MKAHVREAYIIEPYRIGNAVHGAYSASVAFFVIYLRLEFFLTGHFDHIYGAEGAYILHNPGNRCMKRRQPLLRNGSWQCLYPIRRKSAMDT